ncbi:predicted protein [Naegleria gruberi]|uniref:Predicted protein n=1 Tax=Naegleria gruberi TaxID=5762 RepID=D2VEZ7_NAEGR|nr:uncharacterized protein NAEGRDRAFT_67451 [Naegleria gruberi]EFC44593.1 predicted protein [Naegleria gruberi]|eukprot:XP_002677337.1 predicted protein [Naegleria gruberi strain NEG-M]
MSSMPPFVKQNSTSSVSSSSAPKASKPSFRERYQLDSPSSSPRTPTTIGEDGFNSTVSVEETRSPSNIVSAVTSSKARIMALQEVLLSRKEKDRSESPAGEQRKTPFSMDFENRSSPRVSPRNVFDNTKETTPTIAVTSSSNVFTVQGGEEGNKVEVSQDPVQAHLDRIMNRRKERVVTQPEPTQPVMDTPKREQETNDKLQAIFERRKNREDKLEQILIGEDSNSSEDASSASGDIMNEFLKRSVENSRESSPVPTSTSDPSKISDPKIPMSEATYNQPEPRENIQPKIVEPPARAVEDRRDLTPTLHLDHLKSSPMRGSPKMLRFKEEDEISRPIEALPHNVSLWRITGERWKLYNVSSFLSKESMAILSNRTTEQPNNFDAFFNETDTDQGESYPHYQKALQNPYPSYPYDPKPVSNPFSSELNSPQPRMFKFRNLDDLFQASFEVPTENGIGKRQAFRADLNGNFLRCLKTNQVFNQFLSIEEEILNRLITGKEVLKNTPKGKVHKRYLFIDPKNKELVWSENEKKKTGLARASRRIKLADITQLKALEMTMDQARVMKIAVPYDKKPFGLVIVSRTRTAEFIATEKPSEFLAIVVAIALAAHKYGTTI